ncbi:LysR family transcriptional regulator [Paracoccus aminophilus]|uniref:Transcriptional regulator, LysR family n=1 Tax=Paracoccus aminophilus JCM 7686 TaxID=1367847 RepID=S5Y6R2_PARAH|nr:LysR family transcriptional regulator [Paracoccus aminophilus]AGT11280.1 transcriptional regulator, LysR family [Paracoccus aminophilus JCM 7686]
MTLEQLRIFLMVAELEHVTRAAERLHLTQSAVSGAIQTLENTHQLRLFDRVGRGIRLTDEGRVMQRKAQEIMAVVKDTEATLGDLSGLKLGELRIHASQTVSSHWLPRFVMRFAARHPGIALTVEVGNTVQCLEAVRKGLCDLAYVEGAVEGDLGPDEASRIAQQPVAQDLLVLVCAPGHPWAAEPPKDLRRAFATQGWVTRERGSGTRSSFETELRRSGVDPDRLSVVMEFSTNEAVCSGIENSDCIGVVSGLVAGPLIEAGRLRALPYTIGARPFLQLRRLDRHFSRAARAFAMLIDEAGALAEGS